ncbi:MAG: malonyl-ACP O-methyltransferase BioC [Gammaproteobacteria bacterium]|nr:malonyl-ACP O-methyltransferase BioC [Gammaproteobacteria bacterium]
MTDFLAHAPETRAVRRSHARAAETYDAHAVLQREVAARLLARLDLMQLTPEVILDLGAGTGDSARALEARYPKATIILLDAVRQMLAKARSRRRRWFSRSRYLCADAAATGLKDQSIDLIHSNLALHWCTDPDAVLAECRRILKPRGLLIFSTVGPSTLQELRAAWASLDDSPHVHLFMDMHDIGDALIRAGFASPVMERDNLCVTYRDLAGLFADLRATGAVNSHPGRHKGLRGSGQQRALAAAYETHRRNGLLPATYEIVMGHAWIPEQGTRPQDGSTVATFPFHKLGMRKA